MSKIKFSVGDVVFPVRTPLGSQRLGLSEIGRIGTVTQLHGNGHPLVEFNNGVGWYYRPEELRPATETELLSFKLGVYEAVTD